MRLRTGFLYLAVLGLLLGTGLTASQSAKASPRKKAKPSSTKPTVRKVTRASHARIVSGKKKTVRRYRRKRVFYNPWTEPTFADSSAGDSVDGEDLVVRRAAVEALGPYNGSVVVADPNTGRVLSIVNQRLALKSGFQPCSTIKVPVALAALKEGVIERDTMLPIFRRKGLNLTEALARSNNPFFANLGTKLGFDRVSYYARLFGLGEKAGLNIDGEQPGVFPETRPANLTVGLMSSFGEGIRLTPLQLAAMLSAIANGGTLYYLQYPRSTVEAESFVPRVKRTLDIEPWIPDIRPGMSGAVEYGTARRANYDPLEPVLGKTGTCTEDRTHLGWFGSFNDVGRNKLVVVVLLTGGRGVSGPTAAQIAGGVYRRLSVENFFAANRLFSPAALISTQSCCAQ
jgi:cell division protein FtsI/penicillin-binding protein 2